MRKQINIPRIIKINSIEGLNIEVVFNNGQSRKINFETLFKKLKIDENSPAAVLLRAEELKKAELNNHTLSWNNVEQYIKRNGLKIKVPFEIGADVLYNHSEPLRSEINHKVAQLIKSARIKSGLTQKELAIKSGTSRNYISRIENEHSDIELNTLYKIIEIGLGKKFKISIK